MHSIAVHGGVVSPLILLASLIGITVAMMVAYKVFNIKERISHTWSCGYSTCAKTQYTATGFAGPIRRFFNWLYKSDEHFHKELIHNHKTKFSDSHYEVHAKPLFEVSIYDNANKITNKISYWIYKVSYFIKTRYAALIFNLMLAVLFSYRIFAHEFSWATIVLEIIVITISTRILVLGDKK
jgi:hydrogenase-4 component B